MGRTGPLVGSRARSCSSALTSFRHPPVITPLEPTGQPAAPRPGPPCADGERAVSPRRAKRKRVSFLAAPGPGACLPDGPNGSALPKWLGSADPNGSALRFLGSQAPGAGLSEGARRKRAAEVARERRPKRKRASLLTGAGRHWIGRPYRSVRRERGGADVTENKPSPAAPGPAMEPNPPSRQTLW